MSAPPVPPLPPGTNDCIGLERGHCVELLESLTSDRNVRPVGWRIRCTAVCNRQQGEAEVTITWADGTTQVSSMGWMGAAGEPRPAGT